MAVPTVTAVSPKQAPANAGVKETKITLTGTGFTGTTAVKVNGVSAKAFTVTNATTLSVTLPSGKYGKAEIEVTNADGTVKTGLFSFGSPQSPNREPLVPLEDVYRTSQQGVVPSGFARSAPDLWAGEYPESHGAYQSRDAKITAVERHNARYPDKALPVPTF